MSYERIHEAHYLALALRALREDIGTGDITADACVEPDKIGSGHIVAKQELVLCGVEVAETVFRKTDREFTFPKARKDKDLLQPGETILEVRGKANYMLKAERTALNFMQHLSGIATVTRQYVQAIAGTHALVIDTRKTTPGMRALEKYAVRCGGGHNHRFGLFDGALIKENHIRACGDIAHAIQAVRGRAHHLMQIEVEVRDFDELDQALAAKADVVMLDNFSVEDATRAVAHINGRAKAEISGNINLQTIRSYAETGVDLISVGRITHSAPSVDISMLFD